MARVLADFAFRAPKRDRYDWPRFLNGSIWRLRRGVDFHTTCRSFRATAVVAARRAGKRLRSNVLALDEAVVLQALPPRRRRR